MDFDSAKLIAAGLAVAALPIIAVQPASGAACSGKRPLPPALQRARLAGRRAPARFPLLAAHDQTLKCSHLFNILDARGAISVTERVGVIQRVRNLAVGVAQAWMKQQHGAAQEEAA